MATYRVAVTKRDGDTAHFTLRRGTEMGAIRELQAMRDARWVLARLEVYSLSKSTWQYAGREWRFAADA